MWNNQTERISPGDVDGHILMGGSGEDTEQLVEDSGQKIHHHMTFHRMETLGGTRVVKERHPEVILLKPKQLFYMRLPSGI